MKKFFALVALLLSTMFLSPNFAKAAEMTAIETADPVQIVENEKEDESEIIIVVVIIIVK